MRRKNEKENGRWAGRRRGRRALKEGKRERTSAKLCAVCKSLIQFSLLASLRHSRVMQSILMSGVYMPATYSGRGCRGPGVKLFLVFYITFESLIVVRGDLGRLMRSILV